MNDCYMAAQAHAHDAMERILAQMELKDSERSFLRSMLALAYATGFDDAIGKARTIVKSNLLTPLKESASQPNGEQ